MIEDMSAQMLDDGDGWLERECSPPQYDFVAEVVRIEWMVERLEKAARLEVPQYKVLLGSA